MHFSLQMFWQCGDVAKMCSWDGPMAVLGSSFWTKREILGGARGSPLLFHVRNTHIPFCKEGTRTPYASFWSTEIYEIQPPSFSCKQTTLNKLICWYAIVLLQSEAGNHYWTCGWKLRGGNSDQGQMNEEQNVQRWKWWLVHICIEKYQLYNDERHINT